MDWNDDFPSWQNDGSPIAAMSGSEKVTGILYYDDFDRDDEGNEWPLWRIRIEGGESKSLFEFEKWKIG
jgi:hypothetical protein